MEQKPVERTISGSVGQLTHLSGLVEAGNSIREGWNPHPPVRWGECQISFVCFFLALLFPISPTLAGGVLVVDQWSPVLTIVTILNAENFIGVLSHALAHARFD